LIKQQNECTRIFYKDEDFSGHLFLVATENFKKQIHLHSQIPQKAELKVECLSPQSLVPCSPKTRSDISSACPCQGRGHLHLTWQGFIVFVRRRSATYGRLVHGAKKPRYWTHIASHKKLGRLVGLLDVRTANRGGQRQKKVRRSCRHGQGIIQRLNHFRWLLMMTRIRTMRPWIKLWHFILHLTHATMLLDRTYKILTAVSTPRSHTPNTRILLPRSTLLAKKKL
jgi:hypothetical protein